MYDVAIIGAGVIGCAIARELAKYDMKVCVIEKEEDVCSGTSKANSAIIHAGYGASSNTLKAKLNVLGNSMMDQLSKELDFPFKRIGSLVVCSSDEDRKALEELYDQGIRNGVKDMRLLERAELLSKEPNIAEDVVAALYAPSGGIVCPFHMTIALAENAYANGTEFKLDTEVTDITKRKDSFEVKTNRGYSIEAKIVINAAGIYADHIHNMICTNKINIQPRKGEYLLLDKAAGNHINHVIFQLPSVMGKGVLVTPTVHGNLLVGPTASDINNKEGTNTTKEGLDYVIEKAAHSIKDIPVRQVITSFAGLRAHTKEKDFIIKESEEVKGFIDVAGIESPGLSSAPAIGVMVAEIVREIRMPETRINFISTRKGVVNPNSLSIEERVELISKNTTYGNIICRCELISEGEILDAIHRPLGAKSLDAIKRRTRAGMGRCQSGFCTPKLMEIIERELEIKMQNITKCGHNSNIVTGRNKQIIE